MKIAVAARGTNLDAETDPRFGRCPYFVVVESGSGGFTVLANAAAEAGSGAGIAAAQLVANAGADAVVAGNYGPNAHQALSAGGITPYQWSGGTVREAVAAVQSGAAAPLSTASVAAHAGMAQGSAMPPAASCRDTGRGHRSEAVGHSCDRQGGGCTRDEMEGLRTQIQLLTAQLGAVIGRLDQIERGKSGS
jgi:predicted Fe-Mo cluster-binding NifX family protein